MKDIDITQILEEACKCGASDIHLTPDMKPILRIDGKLITIENFPTFNALQTQSLIYSILKPDEKVTLEANLDLDFSFTIPYVGAFRGNAYFTFLGLAVSFRLIPQDIPTIDSLEMPSVFKEILDFRNGLVLVTGPTGCGKSTTLAAMVNHINMHQSKHIITIEDPIEFKHKSINSLITQRQLHRDTYSFSSALRAALREDPDVIMVGEMRDLETIKLALTAAETGHLVLATLHTNSAPQAVNRIVDVFGSEEKMMIRNMLSESLRAVITQTLLRRPHGGRIPAFEIMLGVTAIRNLIREDKIAQMFTTIQTNSSKGMCTLEQYVDELIKSNSIDPNEIDQFKQREILTV